MQWPGNNFIYLLSWNLPGGLKWKWRTSWKVWQVLDGKIIVMRKSIVQLRLKQLTIDSEIFLLKFPSSHLPKIVQVVKPKGAVGGRLLFNVRPPAGSSWRSRRRARVRRRWSRPSRRPPGSRWGWNRSRFSPTWRRSTARHRKTSFQKYEIRSNPMLARL